MNRISAKYIIVIAAVGALFLLPAHAAHACSLVTDSFTTCMNEGAANLANMAMGIMSFLLVIASWLLNQSLQLTINIKSFVDGAPAIYTTWRAIRDISGIFIIFFLLYAAFQLIIGIKKPNFGELIRNIIIAGVLINFSFFIAGLGIDASNIVSLQIYNAIAPTNSLTNSAVTPGVSSIFNPSSFDSTGLATIFMNSLKIQSLYDKTGRFVGVDGTGDSAVGRTIIMGVVGCFIEFAAAASFAIAAAAFLARFVVLIFLLAFSPIMALGIFGSLSQEFKKFTGKWFTNYKAMLIFMPVYLLLMYLAVNVLATTNLFGTPPATPWYAGLLTLGLNGAIVIFLLNLPLVAAADIAGETIGFLGGAVKKWGGAAIRERWTKNVGSYAGSATLGRAAYAAKQSGTVATLTASSPAIGSFVSGQLSKVSSAGFGGDKKKSSYEDRLKARNKAREDTHKGLADLDRSKFSSEAKFKEAQDERKELQKQYRQNLPWKSALTGKPGGVIGFVLDNRANRQTSFSLTEDAELKNNEEKRDKKLVDLAKLQGVEVAYTKDGKPNLKRDKNGNIVGAKNTDAGKYLKVEIDALEGSIERAGGKKKKSDVSALAQALNEQQPKEEGGGGGGGGEEKKEEKKEGS